MRAALLLHVSVDTREPPDAWTFSPDCIVTRETHRSADYAPSLYIDVFGIERKTLPDLVACCAPERPRFVRELERLSTFDFKTIICEASIEDVLRHNYLSRVHENAVIGSVLAFHIDYGVPTIWAGNAANAARIAEKLMRRFVARREAMTAEQTTSHGAING